MNGFGSYSKYNIDEIIKKLEKQISNIKIDYSRDVVVLKNQLSSCAAELEQLKIIVNHVDEYTQQEYNKLNEKINYLNDEIEDIKTKLNTIQYNEILGGKCASGINEFPIYSRYAEKDTNGNIIQDYYAAKSDLSSVSSTLSADYTQKIEDSSSAGMSALSSVSGELTTMISKETTRATSAEENLDNKITAETNRASDSEQFITDNLTGEITRSMGADNEISTSLNNEINRSTNRDDLLQQNINTLSNSVNDKETALNTKIEDETTRATAKETELETALSTETTNRENAIDILETAIENETISRRNEIDVISNNLTEEVNRASQAEETLDSKIDSSVETINGSISDLRSSFRQALEQEQTIRGNADTNLQTSLTNEITARTDADTTLQTNIDNETTARKNADTILQTNITAEETARISADETLQGNITAEINARTAADNNLQTQIDTIEATQNIVDIVGTKTELDDYDTTNLKDGAKIQVLDDESQSHASTIYQFNKYDVPNPTFGLVGTFGSYYTKAETESIVNSAKNELNTIIGTETTNRTNADTALSDRIDTLNNTKQNNLTAGDGIAIANDVVSHSIKIIENNNQEDTVEGTVFTVYLKNNHYKLITFDKTITEIIFMIEKSATGILQETGFEFTVPEDSELETLTFKVIDDNNKKIYTIIPDSYSSQNIYQGTIVNYRCTIGEYEVED